MCLRGGGDVAVQVLVGPAALGLSQRGLVVATIAGALLGFIGVYVTLRGMSYIGHGLSHAIFGGFAASQLITSYFYLGAGIWGLAAALSIGAITRRQRIGADAAIGVITTASFALGVALPYRALLFTTFDPEVADVSGVRVARTDALLMLVLSLAILATLTIIGVTLVAAMLVIPAVVARMMTNSFGRMLFLSTVIGALCGLVGMYASYEAEVPSGTMIVLTGAAVFCVALAVTGLKGLRRTAGMDEHVTDAPVTARIGAPTA